MSRIQDNERSWQIELISKINFYLATQNLGIKHAGGESSILQTNRNSLFPDLLLYADNERKIILQGWEIKMPDTPITDSEWVKNAEQKAKCLSLNSFLLWNFKQAVLYIQNEDGTFQVKQNWNDNSDISTRRMVGETRRRWWKTITRILTSLDLFFQDGVIRSQGILNAASTSVISKILDRNTENVATLLREKANSNTIIETKIRQWWHNNDAYKSNKSENEFKMYAQESLLSWANRFLFANIRKSTNVTFRRVNDINKSTTVEQAIDIFKEITEQSDFFHIFQTIEFSEILSQEAWDNLLEMNNLLKQSVFEQVDHDLYQKTLENSINETKRLRTGQYPTPYTLAHILVSIAMQNWNDSFFDGCCGTGTFARAVLDEKITRYEKTEAYASVWAADKYRFPLQIATINLSEIADSGTLIQTIEHDIFKWERNEEVRFRDPNNGNEILKNIPLFSVFASNVPFIEPSNFDEDTTDSVKTLRTQIQTKTGIQLDERSDIYFYIPFAIWPLLQNNGQVCLITSNSWLATKSAQEFFSALWWYYDIRQIHISGKGRWFSNAKIVTTAWLLKKHPRISNPDFQKKIQFITWMKDLNSLTTEDEHTIIDTSRQGEIVDENVATLVEYSQNEIRELYQYGIEMNALFKDVHWFLSIKSKLIPITEKFIVIRGERRGWNDLFYPNQPHQIESIFLSKILHRPKDIKGYIHPKLRDVFTCSFSEKELKKRGYSGALNWINKFKTEVNGTGRPLPEALQRSNNEYWYELKPEKNNTALFATAINPNERFFWIKFNQATFIDQRLVGLNIKDGTENLDLDLCHALLNSSLAYFIIEAGGFGRGEGVLDLNKKNIGAMWMLNPDLLSEQNKEFIKEAFSNIRSQRIPKVKETFEIPLFIDFYHKVLQAYGIDQFYDNIKDVLLLMMERRLSVNEN